MSKCVSMCVSKIYDLMLMYNCSIVLCVSKYVRKCVRNCESKCE